MSKIIDLTLIFFYIFGFSFRNGTGIDSSMVVALFLLAYGVVNKKYIVKVVNFIRSLYFKNLMICYLVINIWAVFVIIINSSHDFSYLITFLHMFLIVFIGCALCIFLQCQNKNDKIVDYMIISFIIQTCIEWLAYTVPSIKEIINSTKSAATIAKGAGYSGVRANALSGSDFFGLSVAFAAILFIYCSEKNTLFKKNKIMKLIVYCFIVSGTFFAGRTGFIGCIIAFIYILIKDRTIHIKKIRLKEFLMGLILSVVGILTIPYIWSVFSNDSRFSNLLNFAFQIILSKKNTGSMEISSLQSLKRMYNISFDVDTFFIGDGWYTAANGSYYMGTDVGYLRVVLFMGIIGLLLLIIMQLLIINPRKGKELRLKNFLIILLLILNLKGEVIVWGQIIVAVVILYSLQDLFSKEYDYGKNNSINDNI